MESCRRYPIFLMPGSHAGEAEFRTRRPVEFQTETSTPKVTDSRMIPAHCAMHSVDQGVCCSFPQALRDAQRIAIAKGN